MADESDSTAEVVADKAARRKAYLKTYQEENKDRIRARERAWALANPEKVLSRSRKYAAANREKERARCLAYRTKNKQAIRDRIARNKAENPERQKEYSRRYRAKHHDRVKALERERYWKNPDKFRAKSLSYLKANPERHALVQRARRARSRSAEGSHTIDDTAAIRKRQNGRCAYCKEKLGRKAHLDHILALANGGSNWPSNLQWLCAPCNQSKSDRDAIEFARSRGLLL